MSEQKQPSSDGSHSHSIRPDEVLPPDWQSGQIEDWRATIRAGIMAASGLIVQRSYMDENGNLQWENISLEELEADAAADAAMKFGNAR